MLYAPHSLLLFAVCFIASLQVGIAVEFACSVTRNFTMKISPRQRVRISGLELNVDIEKKTFDIYHFDGTESMELSADRTTLTFTGNIAIYDGSSTIKREQLLEVYQDRLTGIAHRALPDPLDLPSNDCRLILIPTGINSSSLNVRIASRLRQMAETCVQRTVCRQIELMMSQRKREDDFVAEYDPEKFQDRSASSVKSTDPATMNDNSSHCNTLGLQRTVNTLVDIGFHQLINTLATENGTKVALPDIHKNISVPIPFVNTYANFSLHDGLFSDIRTLRRRKDVVLSHDGFQFLAGLELGLDVVHVEYKTWKLKYGVGASGKVLANVSGVALGVEISIDYNRYPCVVALDYVKVTEFGKVHFEMTGLGKAFGWLVTKVADWIDSSLHKNIVSILETKIAAAARTHLEMFNCERFRL